MIKTKQSLETWKAKLEDTSKHNKAINFKEHKLSQIKLIYPRIEDMFNLFNEKNLEFANLFNKDENEVLEDANLESQGEINSKKDVYSYDELEQSIISYLGKVKKTSKKFIFTNRPTNIQNNVLKTIESKIRLFTEENAINIGYMTLGMVEWREDLNSEVYYKAPLFFVPIELSQESFNSPFKLTIKEDDLSLNSSFLQMIDQMFNIKIDFEIDSDKTNYSNYLTYKEYFISKITDNKWEIKDDVHIGMFAFSKINMLNDIKKNQEEILNNKIIQMLSGEEVKFDKYDEINEEELDSKIDPSEYFRTLDADSSQELAIDAAIKGQSFVLQGPPGTGKSQTITNIISELIARGKKVLFVAEKKAALDVVYKNLAKVDLHEFALPIHNKDMKPKELIMDLNNTLLNGQTTYVYDKNDISNLEVAYNSSKNSLNDYAKAITKKRKPLNKSIYELYGLYLKYNDIKENRFNIISPEKIDSSKINSIENIISSFLTVFKEVNYIVKENAWYGLNLTSLGSAKKEEIEDLLLSIDGSISDLNKYFVKNILTLNKTEDNNINTLFNLIQLYEKISNYNMFDENILKHIVEKKLSLEELNNDLDKLKRIKELEQISINQLEFIKKYYHEEVLNEDIKNTEFIIRVNNTFFKKLFNKEYKNVKKTFKKYFIKKIRKNKNFKIDINNMMDYQQTIIDKNELSSKTQFLNIESLFESSTDTLISRLSWLIDIFELIKINKLNMGSNLLDIYININKDKSMLEEEYENLTKILNKLEHNIKLLETNFNSNLINFNTLPINIFENKIKEMLDNQKNIQNYINFNNVYLEGVNLEITDFFEYLIDNKIKTNIWEIFNKRFYQLLIDHIIANDSILTKFMVSDYENFKNTFALKDQELINIAKVRVKSMIRDRYPSVNGLESNNYEISLLRREANKSRRHLPIRKIMESMPNLLTTLKPCLMMSPLAVSTYLINTDLKFDTVIFDEASQVTPENAIGAIYRAKQVIIVGDKEQLPPTNFFNNSYESDDDNYSEVEDFASILELASGSIISIPLTWHYRSRTEDLIQPSNRFIYKNLITFPSSSEKTPRAGIDFIKVNGVYQNNINQVEAKEVARLVFEHFDMYKHDRSLGVVAFSQNQSKAIENEIDKIRRLDSKYEDFFDRTLSEPFFIKNIETVQGDERDTIISSVCYGPNPLGKISMNFGPINKDGGYRRLNVAFTRAKINQILVSSITENDIDINRSKQVGVLFLKEYLKFAEFGIDSKLDDLDYFADFDSPFEQDVYNEIKKMGYKVDKQVGSSGYKIDLAVKNDKGNYILGVECDGATYHSSKSSRNRDRLRQAVLEDRGWTIYRIWSTDWFKNRDTEIRKLIDAIKENINGNIKKKENNTTVLKTVEVSKEPEYYSFETYPDYDKFTINIYDYASKYDGLINILKELAPIHYNELKKVLPRFYNRQTFSSHVEEGFKSDLKKIRRFTNDEITIKDNFILDKSKKIKFRKHNNLKRRDFQNIHLEEIAEGFLENIKITHRVEKDLLYKNIIELSGYSAISNPIRQRLDNALNILVIQEKVILQDNIVEYVF